MGINGIRKNEPPPTPFDAFRDWQPEPLPSATVITPARKQVRGELGNLQPGLGDGLVTFGQFSPIPSLEPAGFAPIIPIGLSLKDPGLIAAMLDNVTSPSAGRFADMVKQRLADDLDSWLNDAENSELHSFAAGLRQDSGA